MSVAPPMASKPQQDNVPAGTYAIRVGQKQQIWRLRESDDPFSDELEWEKVGERTIDSVPRSSYEGGRWDADKDGDIWFYVEDISPDEDGVTSQATLETSAPYVLKIHGSDKTHTVSGNNQASAFGSALEILLTKYDLAEQLDLPYVPGYKNAALNTEPRHPNGEEMERSRPIADGDYYFSTQPTKGQKIEMLNEFSELVDMTISYVRGWED